MVKPLSAADRLLEGFPQIRLKSFNVIKRLACFVSYRIDSRSARRAWGGGMSASIRLGLC